MKIIKMAKKGVELLNSKTVYYLFTLLVFVTVFCLLGEKGYLIWKDSQAYLAFDGRTGIVPIYPLFLRINRMIFGEDIFLYAVVVEQTVFTMCCILVFMEFIRKRFRLSYLAAYPVLLFSVFMPFTTNYPLSISNHDIMTEALAYPLFYIYMICFLKTIFDKKYKDVVVMVLVSVVLALIRTQLQLTGAFNATAFFYISWMKGRKYPVGKQIIRGAWFVLLSAFVLIAGELLVLGANATGQRLISFMNSSQRMANTEESTEMVSAQDVFTEMETVQEESAETIEATVAEAETVSEETSAETDGFAETEGGSSVSNVADQYGHLVIDKAIYEIDEDDYLLFENEELQKLCQAIYQQADEDRQRYVYMRDNLWRWQDIMNGIGDGTRIASAGWDNYLAENPDTTLTFDAVNQVAATLLFAHIGRVIWHMLCMMPQGFICTVFFQKADIYLFCHLITLFIYVSAILLTIWGYRRKGLSRQYPEFMLGCIVINVLFVVIQSIMFFAMQRYLVYCFGIFYVAYYLIALEFLRCCRERIAVRSAGADEEK